MQKKQCRWLNLPVNYTKQYKFVCRRKKKQGIASLECNFIRSFVKLHMFKLKHRSMSHRHISLVIGMIDLYWHTGKCMNLNRKFHKHSWHLYYYNSRRQEWEQCCLCIRSSVKSWVNCKIHQPHTGYRIELV